MFSKSKFALWNGVCFDITTIYIMNWCMFWYYNPLYYELVYVEQDKQWSGKLYTINPTTIQSRPRRPFKQMRSWVIETTNILKHIDIWWNILHSQVRLNAKASVVNNSVRFIYWLYYWNYYLMNTIFVFIFITFSAY
jgi:hypothetical protein